MLGCGDPDDTGVITASDALFLLRVAVNASACDRCVCDVDSSGAVNASDALRVLRAAVKIPVVMSCPACF